MLLGFAMFTPSTSPKTYQELKVSLVWITSILSATTIVLLHQFVVPDEARQAIPQVFNNPLADFGVLVAACSVVAYFLIVTLEFHQRVYDGKIVRWRRAYDLNFILPRLVQPFGNRIDPRFFAVAEKERGDFMKLLFYVFVGDRRKDGVNENTKVRFYESATGYWTTQIIEMLLLFSIVVLIVCFWWYTRHGLPLQAIVWGFIVIFVLFILNRLWMRSIRDTLRGNTLDQVEEIHARLAGELDNALTAVHAKYNLVYRA